jgi:NAD(P)-dependent dehydrogenase (short-subunit alcohol dehydrogenase family)
MSTAARYPSLEGRAVLITGGATGIGAAFVERFHDQGAKVAFVDRDAPSGERLRDKLGAARPPAPLFIPCDVTDTGALRAAVAAVRTALGPVSVLVNNAANDQRHQVEAVTPEFWEQCINVNLRHQFFAAQAVVEDMTALGGGSIINLGSISWMIKASGYPVYATSKAAIQGLTRSLARDLGRHKIRVNAIVPGWVMTERQLKLWVDAEAEKQLDASQCLPGRLMPDDIAAMALFLAADDSRMCTAQDFIVDAGWS